MAVGAGHRGGEHIADSLRSAGTRLRATITSPDSQCLPTMRTGFRAIGFGRPAAGTPRTRCRRGWARVVAHASVDGDVGAYARDLLDGAHGVEGHGRPGNDRPPGLRGDSGGDAGVAACRVTAIGPLA